MCPTAFEPKKKSILRVSGKPADSDSDTRIRARTRTRTGNGRHNLYDCIGKGGKDAKQYNNTPFSVAESRRLELSIWAEVLQTTAGQGKRLWLQDTGRFDAMLMWKLKHLATLYPDYAISPGESEGLSKWKLRCLQEEKIKMDRRDIEAFKSIRTVHTLQPSRFRRDSPDFWC